MLGYALAMLFFFFTAPLLLFNVFVLLPPKVFEFCILHFNPSTFSLPYSTGIPWGATQASENVVIAVAGHLGSSVSPVDCLGGLLPAAGISGRPSGACAPRSAAVEHCASLVRRQAFSSSEAALG